MKNDFLLLFIRSNKTIMAATTKKIVYKQINYAQHEEIKHKKGPNEEQIKWKCQFDDVCSICFDVEVKFYRCSYLAKWWKRFLVSLRVDRTAS